MHDGAAASIMEHDPMPSPRTASPSSSQDTKTARDSTTYHAMILNDIIHTMRASGLRDEATIIEKHEKPRALRMDASIDDLEERQQQRSASVSTMWSQADRALARAVTAGPVATTHLIDHIATSGLDSRCYMDIASNTHYILTSSHLGDAMKDISPRFMTDMKEHVLTTAITTIAKHGWNDASIMSILRAGAIVKHMLHVHRHTHGHGCGPASCRPRMHDVSHRMHRDISTTPTVACSKHDDHVDTAFHDLMSGLYYMEPCHEQADARQCLALFASGSVKAWHGSSKKQLHGIMKRCIATMTSAIEAMPADKEKKPSPGRPAATITIPESKRMAAIEGIATWMGNGHIGASSQALASRIIIACMGSSTPHEPDYHFPHGADDFMRCEHLMVASKLPTSTLQAIMSDMGGPWKHLAKNLRVVRTCASSSASYHVMHKLLTWHNASAHHDDSMAHSMDSTISTSIKSAAWTLAFHDAATHIPEKTPT
jgi:hypothetical protein